MKYPSACLLVMSKAPVPGRVKTRLAPLLGEQQAASFYRKQLERTLQVLAGSGLCPLELHCAPDCEHPFFTDCAQRFNVVLQPQHGDDLGERMLHALRKALQDARYAIVVGCDCPTLAADDIDEAIQSLADGTDVVLGPARDGGYYLIGMRTPHASLFTAIPWGSSQVLSVTHARIRQAGLSVSCVTERADIDTPDDYQAWQQQRALRHK